MDRYDELRAAEETAGRLYLAELDAAHALELGEARRELAAMEASLTTTTAELEAARARIRVLEEAANTPKPPAGWAPIPAPSLSSATGWTVQNRRDSGAAGTQKNDNSVNLKENTLFEPGRLRIVGNRLATPIENRPFGSGDALARHVAIPNHCRVEVDAVLPTIPGAWPCPAWLRPLGGPGDLAVGEFDLVETWPHDWPRRGVFPGGEGWAAIHPQYDHATDRKQNAPFKYAQLRNPNPAGLHTYALEKTYRRAAFYVDELLVYEWTWARMNDNTKAWWDKVNEIDGRTWYGRVTLQVGGPHTGGYPENQPNWPGCEMVVSGLRYYREA